jgi:hypothetical protein
VAGYAFAGWDGIAGLDDATSNPISLLVENDLTITPRFDIQETAVPRPGDVSIVAAHVDDVGEIEGDWFDLVVQGENDVDLRGWRVTDNDTVLADDEGSLIFMNDPLFADLSPGTIVRVIATKTPHNTQQFADDGRQNGVLVLYVGNGRLSSERDPWFNLGARDNLVLLAPGPTAELGDDIAVGFWSRGSTVSPASFGLPPDFEQAKR